ncbi:MAG: TonB-dependent receptor [Bacteroidota bacterium]|nr:TonB-dependent receptor [Bacteroidota bacterium]
MKKAILLLCCLIVTQLLLAQTWKVSGVVKGSEDGLPLPGVSVVIKGAKATGTITDADGKFSINVPAGHSLSFTYIGYRPLVKEINKNQDLNISLESDSRMLDEVVAIGYGTMKKSDLTGAVGSVSGKELKMAPVARVDQALQGRMAGVTVNSNSGQPGADAIIHIRGVGTTGVSTPIYVVDGIVTDNINFLSTSDIASLEVLKDASTAAIYGSRGANGVILITTKKGDKTGKANITFESYVGTQNTWKKLDVMGRDEFANLVALMGNTKKEYDAVGLNEWIRSNYTPNSDTRYPRIIEHNTDGSVKTPGIDYTKYDTNWQDQVFVKNAMMHNYYVSADGGTEKGNYLMSFNKFDQDGTLIGSYYNRMTIRLNTSMEVKKWLRIGENLSFTNSHSYNVQNNGNTALIASALSMAPWDPLTYAAGSLSGYPGKQVAKQVDLSGRYSTPSLFRNVMHPYNQVYNSKPNNTSIDWVGDIYAELRPFKGLVVRGDVSSKMWNGSSRTYNPVLDVIYNATSNNSVSASETQSQQLTYEGTATYNTKFLDKHEITAMVGSSMEEVNSYSVNASGNYLTNTSPTNWYVNQTSSAVYDDPVTKTPTSDRTGGDAVSKGRMASYFGRLNYTFDSKYLLTGNFRYDGSSKLSTGHYWRAFPSVAGAWKISEESFFEPVKKTIDYMKLRVGWGLLGNERILSETGANTVTWETATYMVGYPYGTPSNLANGVGLSAANFPQIIEWERTKQTDIGFDFGLFGKISGNLDLYRRLTEGMLMTVKAPAHVGFIYDVTANAATVRNDGIEFSLDYHDKIGAFNYSIGGNLSLTDNKLTATNGGQAIWDGFIMSDQGYALKTIYVMKYQGVFQTQDEINAYTWTNPTTGAKQLIQPSAKPGDAKYADLNHDGQITSLDRYDAGNAFPPLTYGFNVTANYKGFDLQVFFQGVSGNEVYNALRQNKLELDGSAGILSTDMRNVFYAVRQNPNDPTSPWINGVPGSNGSIPNPTKTAGNATDNALASSRFVEDASYLRLKNLQLGYTIPENLTRKVGINRVRFYIGGSNLLTFTKYKGFDPEVGSDGRDYGNFPQARTVLVGLNMNF